MFFDNYKRLCELNNEKPYSLPLKLGAKSNSMVAQWKKGSTPRPEMLQLIADYFNVSTNELLKGETDIKEKLHVSENANMEQSERLLLELFRKLPLEDRKREIAYLQSRTADLNK